MGTDDGWKGDGSEHCLLIDEGTHNANVTPFPNKHQALRFPPHTLAGSNVRCCDQPNPLQAHESRTLIPAQSHTCRYINCSSYLQEVCQRTEPLLRLLLRYQQYPRLQGRKLSSTPQPQHLRLRCAGAGACIRPPRRLLRLLRLLLRAAAAGCACRSSCHCCRRLFPQVQQHLQLPDPCAQLYGRYILQPRLPLDQCLRLLLTDTEGQLQRLDCCSLAYTSGPGMACSSSQQPSS